MSSSLILCFKKVGKGLLSPIFFVNCRCEILLLNFLKNGKYRFYDKLVFKLSMYIVNIYNSLKRNMIERSETAFSISKIKKNLVNIKHVIILPLCL